MKIIPDFTPDEITNFMRNFYNETYKSGLSQKVGEKINEILREDSSDMTQEEVIKVWAGVHASGLESKPLLEYLDSLVDK